MTKRDAIQLIGFIIILIVIVANRAKPTLCSNKPIVERLRNDSIVKTDALREHLPRSLFLVLGYGAQGGDAKSAVAGLKLCAAGFEGEIVNSSRGVLYPPDVGHSAIVSLSTSAALRRPSMTKTRFSQSTIVPEPNGINAMPTSRMSPVTGSQASPRQ